jgi:hypothetical protein
MSKAPSGQWMRQAQRDGMMLGILGKTLAISIMEADPCSL